MIKLPFTTAAAFPASAFEPSRARLQQGVEARARAAVPAPPVINTTASDRVAALGRSAVPMASAAMPGPAPVMPTPAAAPLNPLGGMDARPLSARGNAGPMSYSPRGVGTTNPNAFAVGVNNRNRPAPVMPGMAGPVPAALPLMMSGPGSAPAPGGMSAPVPGRDDAFWSGLQGAAPAPEEVPQGAPEIFALEGAGGYVPMIRQPDGSTKAAGGFFPGAAPDTMALPALPLSAEEQAQTIARQAREQEAQFLGMGLVPTLPKQATDAAGRTYGPPAERKPKMVKVVDDQGRVVDFPEDYELPPAWTALTRKGEKPAVAAPPANYPDARALRQTPSGNTIKRL